MTRPAREDDGRSAPLAWALGVVLLAGVALPLEAGLGLALVTAVAAWFGGGAGGGAASDDGSAPRLLRGPAAAATLLVAAIVATLAARGVAALTVAFPAMIPALVLPLVVALAGPRLHGRGLGGALALALALTPAAVALGAAIERGAADARGEAYSGPILGIHPFQSTAIVIDGYGPFNLPVNDYVEPTGWRGYGPEALAEAIERDLHRIAELHFADGPARARVAFAGARVDAIELPAVRERLDRAPEGARDPRLHFTSGTTGQGSRVELVCPGSRSDPRGLQPDPVTDRMCPNRYAAEESAGLGLTGRWTGYVERRGNERMGLGRALGWTRSDDREGGRSLRAELRLSALLLLALGAAMAWGPGAALVARLGAWAALAAVAVALALGSALLLPPRPLVGLVDEPPAGHALLSISAWAGLLALGGWLGASPADASPRRLAPRRIAAAIVALGTLAAASDLRLSAWLRPELWERRGLGIGAGARTIAWERWVIEAGDRLHSATALDLAVAEGLVAAALALALLGFLAAVLRELPWAAARLLPGRRAPVLARAAALALAAGLVFSQQTHGAALLLAPALALAWTAAAARALPRGERGRGGALRIAVLTLSGLLTVVAAIQAASAGRGPVLAALTAAIAALALLLVLAALLDRRRRQSGC